MTDAAADLLKRHAERHDKREANGYQPEVKPGRIKGVPAASKASTSNGHGNSAGSGAGKTKSKKKRDETEEVGFAPPSEDADTPLPPMPSPIHVGLEEFTSANGSFQPDESGHDLSASASTYAQSQRQGGSHDAQERQSASPGAGMHAGHSLNPSRPLLHTDDASSGYVRQGSKGPPKHATFADPPTSREIPHDSSSDGYDGSYYSGNESSVGRASHAASTSTSAQYAPAQHHHHHFRSSSTDASHKYHAHHVKRPSLLSRSTSVSADFERGSGHTTSPAALSPRSLQSSHSLPGPASLPSMPLPLPVQVPLDAAETMEDEYDHNRA